MKEFIEKLIGRLEQEKTVIRNKYLLGRGNPAVLDGRMRGIEDSIEIVNQLAEEYGKDINVRSNGWIPCSERLPSKEEYLKDSGRFIATDGNRVYQSYYDVYEGMFMCSAFASVLQEDKCIIAWQPLPPKYQPKG